MTLRGRVARVILDSPLPQLDHELDYSIPDSLDESVEVGSLVSLPLRGGARFVEGWVVDRVDKSDFAGALQPINKVISGLPILSGDTLALARRIALRQAGSVSDVLRLAIPPRFVRTEKAWLTEQHSSAEPAKDSDPATASLTSLTSYELGIEPGGRIAFSPKIAWHTPSSDQPPVPEWALNFAAEAYRLIQDGQSSILSTPDFRELHHLLRALDMCGAAQHVLRTDAGIAGKDRYRNYLEANSTTPQIIVGNRSAALSPAHNLGLIAMWDDGDENYQEPLAPYPHARDVALLRQSLTGARLVFAAHTVTTDIARLCELGFLSSVSRLSATPRVIANDQIDDRGYAVRIPADAILAARAAAQDAPILVQVASPGFSPAVVCSTCREIAQCTQCGGPLGLKREGSTPQCRWCQAMATAWSCHGCQGSTWQPVGFGAERTAAEIGKAFPGVPILVADAEAGLEFIDSQPRIVIATAGAEPVAQNGYGAVLLLDGERRRFREALRAPEDAVRVWANATALAKPGASIFISGAGDRLGHVMSTWAFTDFARGELVERQQLRLPPTSRIATITGPEKQVRTALEVIQPVTSVRVLGTENKGDDGFIATITCDFRHNDEVATALRARIIAEATTGPRSRGRGNGDQRVVKLRVRFDETSINS